MPAHFKATNSRPRPHRAPETEQSSTYATGVRFAYLILGSGDKFPRPCSTKRRTEQQWGETGRRKRTRSAQTGGVRENVVCFRIIYETEEATAGLRALLRRLRSPPPPHREERDRSGETRENRWLLAEAFEFREALELVLFAVSFSLSRALLPLAQKKSVAERAAQASAVC